jgi:hypothetical protein
VARGGTRPNTVTGLAVGRSRKRTSAPVGSSGARMLADSMIQPTARSLISHYLPSFHWITGLELVAMIEQIDDRVNYSTIFVALEKLRREGLV